MDRGTPIQAPSVVAAMRLTNLGVEHGYLDPNPHNEAGAGFFVCGQPGAPEQTVLVMVSKCRQTHARTHRCTRPHAHTCTWS